MQISKRAKVAFIVVSCVVIVPSLIVTIDELDFVARWLGHLEAYKDNIERVIYACLLLPLLSAALKKLRVRKSGKNVKGLKATVGIFGFEIEFDDDDSANSSLCDDDATRKKAGVEAQSRNVQASCRGYAMARKIISMLSSELQLTFATNAILTRGGCRYMPDGFAVRNGRAYIVEIKAMDRRDLIEGAIAQLKIFSNMMHDMKIAHVTLIFCVVSDRPVEYFTKLIRNIDLGEKTDFVLRVFAPKLLELEEMM